MNTIIQLGKTASIGMIIIVIVAALASSITAQTERAATDDDVARVAEQMYCPVCENIPLDDCGTATCVSWKEEIREQLNNGATDQEIIDGFVDRYGQHVVGIPQDPVLRSISLLIPWISMAVIIILGGFTFLRWRANPIRGAERAISVPDAIASQSDDADYRARFESDLN